MKSLHSPQKNNTAYSNISNGYTLPYIKRHCPSNKSRMEQMNGMQPTDYGPYPFAANMTQVAKNNSNFRTALWTGPHLQITLMSLLPGEDIGLEQHNTLDQFVYIEQGKGMVMMGDQPNQPNFQQMLQEHSVFVIPAGKWHNLTNIGSVPLKLFSIYAPPQHPFGTVQPTKEDAQAAENHS